MRGKRLPGWAMAGIGFVAGLAVASIGVGAAATLTPLTPRNLGTTAAVVAACDSSIGVSWDDGATSPVFAGNATVANSTFNVSTVKLTGVDAACNGQNFKVVAAASTGTQLQVASGTISGAPTVSITIPAQSSKTIEQIVVTIYQ